MLTHKSKEAEATRTPVLEAEPASSLLTAFQAAPDQHPALVYLGRLAERSRRRMEIELERIARLVSGDRLSWLDLPWPALRYQHVQVVRSRLIEAGDLRPASVNLTLSALRGVLREAWRLGYVDAEKYHRAIDVEQVRGETLPAGRDLSAGEVRALAEACASDPSPAGARDAALLAVLVTGGLRRAEVVALELADYEPETGSLRVCSGKGRKERQVYAANGAARALADWLEARGTDPDPLFCPVNKGGRLELRPMTAQAVYLSLAKRARQAGVPAFSPHDLRRTFIGDLLDAGADIVTVQKLAGHAQPGTTSRYDRRGERTKQEAAARLHFPHVRRRWTGAAAIANRQFGESGNG